MLLEFACVCPCFSCVAAAGQSWKVDVQIIGIDSSSGALLRCCCQLHPCCLPLLVPSPLVCRPLHHAQTGIAPFIVVMSSSNGAIVDTPRKSSVLRRPAAACSEALPFDALCLPHCARKDTDTYTTEKTHMASSKRRSADAPGLEDVCT